VLATLPQLGLERPAAGPAEQLRVAGLGGQLGGTEPGEILVHVRVREHVPPDAPGGRNLPAGSRLPPSRPPHYHEVSTAGAIPGVASREAEGPALRSLGNHPPRKGAKSGGILGSRTM
jgi:hypothetical protein